jgi:hypothetical protein
MAEALGIAASAESMAGTLLLDLPNSDELSKQRSSIKDTVDLAWSNEALGRGVAEAKAGRPALPQQGPAYAPALQHS